jgi:hypothetical protein
MNASPLILKNPRGWFAAGAEVQMAMTLLSDGAFRLFVHLCMNAHRDTGVLESSLTQLAKNIGRGHHTVRLYLREMQTAGICRFHFSHSPLGRGMIEITESFWPYQKNPEETPADDSAIFMAEIRKMLQARACVRPLQAAADEIQAREWFDRGISIEHIEQAILIGCVRKYVSWRNNQTRTLIGSLRYFEPILQELENMKSDPDYWSYLRYRLGRMENQWKERPGKSTPIMEEESEGVVDKRSV